MDWQGERKTARDVSANDVDSIGVVDGWKSVRELMNISRSCDLSGDIEFIRLGVLYQNARCSVYEIRAQNVFHGSRSGEK